MCSLFDNEAVTEIDNGGSVPSVDHSNAIVMQETAEENIVAFTMTLL